MKSPTRSDDGSASSVSRKKSTAAANYSKLAASGKLKVDKDEVAAAKAAGYVHFSPSGPPAKSPESSLTSSTEGTEDSGSDDMLVSPPRTGKASAGANFSPTSSDDESANPKKLFSASDDVIELSSMEERSEGSSEVESVNVFSVKSDKSDVSSLDSEGVEALRKEIDEAAAAMGFNFAATNIKNPASNSTGSLKPPTKSPQVKFAPSSKADSNKVPLTKSKNVSSPPVVQVGISVAQKKAAASSAPTTSASKSNSSPNQAAYNPPIGAYSRVIDSDTTSYFSGMDIEDALIAICKASSPPETSPAHHANSPFKLLLTPDKTYDIVNVHGTVCGNIGPRQEVDCFGPPDYLPLQGYAFKATPLTSYHYPTAVLACHLQLVSKHNGNDEDCVSHSNNGPFRVVHLTDSTLCLVNNRQEQVCLLPFPKALDNKLRPWQYRGDSVSNSGTTTSNPQSPNANPSMGTETEKNDTDVEMTEASGGNATSPAPDSGSPSMFSGNSNQTPTSPSNQVKRQTPLANKQSSGAPNGSASAPVFGPAIPPPSTLKQSSYNQAPHNEVVPIVHPPENLMIGLGDVPTNKSGVPVFVLFSVPPVDSQHPCDFFHGGTITMLQVVSRFDITFVLCPLRRKDGKLPNIPAAIPKAYPPSYEHLVPYIDVPNGDQLKLAVGVIRYGKNKGQKRKQQ
jgi:hypothetical protein